MPKKLSIRDFGIEDNAIPQEIKDLYLNLPKKRILHLEKAHGSAYDFIVILHYLRFIEKLENSEIAERLETESEPIHSQLYNFGWHYSSDYAENKTQHLTKLNETKTLFERALEIAPSLNENEHPRLRESLKKVQRIRARTYLDLGFKTGEEYVRVFYYLRFIEGVSPKSLIPLFGLPYGTIQLRLKTLGLNETHAEGIDGKVKRGSQDYGKSFRNAKKVTNKSRIKNFSSTSSKNEEYVRGQLPNYIYDYLDSKKYDVIVGLGTTGILNSLEIDIPIVVFDIEKNCIYRFAVEYGADFFHTPERDEKKRALAISRGWYHKAVIEPKNNRYSNDQKQLQDVIHDICKYIQTVVNG